MEDDLRLLHREHDLFLSLELVLPLQCEHVRFLVLDCERDLLRPLDLDRDFLSLECERDHLRPLDLDRDLILSLECERDLLEYRLLLWGDILRLLSRE